MYITSSTNSTANNIYYNEGMGTVSNLSTYQGNEFSGGNYSGIQENWYVIAGQQFRNGVSGSSCAVSLSCPIQILNGSQCGILINQQTSSGQGIYSWNIIRIG